MIEAQCMKTNQNSEDLNKGKKERIDVNTVVSKYPSIKNWPNETYLYLFRSL